MRFAHFSLFGICALTLGLIVYVTELLDKIDEIVTQYESDLSALRGSIKITESAKPGHCALPRLDPFDPSILQYIELPTTPLDCTKEYGRPALFTTDYGSNLVQLEDPAKYGLHDCCFRPFELVTEEQVMVGETCYPITANLTPIHPRYEFIVVFCSDNGIFNGWIPWTSRTLTIDMLDFVHELAAANLPKPRAPKVIANAGKGKKKDRDNDSLNVVLIGLDGVSHMNLIRMMPLTYSYLENVSAIGMNGYTKVGDNTFPNVMPLLTGMSAQEVESEGGCWGGKRLAYFDTCPFIWKNFSQAGYATSYAEDAQGIATFNYEKAGFKTPPTDFYLRAFLGRLGDVLGHTTTGNVNLCYGPRMGLKVVLDHVTKLAVTMARPSVDRKYFAVTWSNTISHDVLNTPNYGDKDLLDFLEWFEERGLEDTALILLSDHGIRTGDIRATAQGRIEERMPFLYFLFPKWFQVKYETAMENLRANGERLTTPFDLHETLLDLVYPGTYISEKSLKKHRHINLGNQSTSSSLLPRGISLFAPVPQNRTCTDAGIEPHWCVCHSMQPVPNPGSDQRVLNVTAAIMETLNGMLVKYPQCAKLTLSDILSAQEVQQPVLANADENRVSKLKQSTSVSTLSLTVTFKVAPSDAVFEATVVQDPRKLRRGREKWVVSGAVGSNGDGEISRLNMYGNQSRCVDEYRLKKYCFCS